MYSHVSKHGSRKAAKSIAGASGLFKWDQRRCCDGFALDKRVAVEQHVFDDAVSNRYGSHNGNHLASCEMK